MVMGRKEVVGVGIQALRNELLLDAGVPEVLDLVVGPAGQVFGNLRPPVAEYPVNVDDCPLLLRRERPPLEVGSQVVYPPQPATLATSLQACT